LTEWGVPPIPHLTLEGARQIANFQNLKAQCAFKLAELVETHRIAARPGGDQDEITEEFSQIKQKDMDKDGKLKIVGKDEVREALGRSPDVADTFHMRMWFELIKDATTGTHEQATTAMQRWQMRCHCTSPRPMVLWPMVLFRSRSEP
jgi:hypothetical protein